MAESKLDDTELFICKVKKYPEIWNVAAEEYHNRMKKRGAWISISRVFFEVIGAQFFS